jgi:hypothetical protein
MCRKIFFLFVSLIFISGCEKSVRDVKYFREHKKERQSVLAVCENNPGELRDTPECINVEKSEKGLYSISYFLKDKEELKRVLAECNDNPGSAEDKCYNVNRANFRIHN